MAKKKTRKKTATPRKGTGAKIGAKKTAKGSGEKAARVRGAKKGTGKVQVTTAKRKRTKSPSKSKGKSASVVTKQTGHDLFGFNRQPFEQFVQAVATHVIGPGIIIYGDGPDGGREATFEGEIPFPHDTDRWNGYGVVQAKCKAKTEGTQKDQQWALEQIKDELENFVKSKKRSRKPEYYIFATNVTLTPPARSGGKDKVDELFKRYGKKLSLKGYRIWDATQLWNYLASYDQLRTRFDVYTTPGDVLAQIRRWFKDQQPDFASIAAAFVDNGLRGERRAKLDHAGDRTDDPTSLAEVFIDLPVSPQPTQDPPKEEVQDGRPPAGFLRELIDIGGHLLDPKSLDDPKPDTRSEAPPKRRLTNRFVLIGGPGSGKSTLGQFLAQIHRAAIVDRQDKRKLTADSKRVIAEIRRHCDRDEIPWPATPRFPFRIDLSAFATALASDGEKPVKTLLEYLTEQMRGDRSMRVEDLLRWLGLYPWLLVLDGLDEVPASANRDKVITAVQDFLSEAQRVSADLLVVATTRKEGYSGELGTDTYVYRHLPPLSTVRALAYVKRFADARYGSDKLKIKEMVDCLQDASRDAMTAKLMQTPLQVTFMVTLVAAGGRPPRERWKLFHDYYEIIFKREQQKAKDDLQSVFARQRTLLDRLHHDVAYLLQVRSEQPGETESAMSHEEFRSRLDTYLTDDEQEGKEKQRLETLIGQATTDRLVFLTATEREKITFEIRSLQEYLAAQRLMADGDDLTRERMEAIAAIPYWRNVFLFMAGRCFAQQDYLCPVVKGVCDQLNESGDNDLAAVTRAGSRLALDLLEDGMMAGSPKYTKMFARVALGLIDLPPRSEKEEAQSTEPVCVRLARLCEGKVESVFREEIDKRLQRRDLRAQLGAWSLLTELIRLDVSWAVELAEKCWPDTADDQFLVLKPALERGGGSPWLVHRFVGIAPQIDPLEFEHQAITNTLLGSGAPKWLSAPSRAAGAYYEDESARLHLPDTPDEATWVGFSLVPISGGQRPAEAENWGALASVPDPAPRWMPWVAAARFMQNPTRTTLAAALRELSRIGDLTVPQLTRAGVFPWPLHTVLAHASTVEELDVVAEAVANGELGDEDDWKAAERRWLDRGVTLDDLAVKPHPLFPFDAGIARAGFAFPSRTLSLGSVKSVQPTLGGLLTAFDTCESAHAKGMLASLLTVYLAICTNDSVGRAELPEASRFRAVFEQPSAWHISLGALFAFEWPEKLDPDWLELLERLGRSDHRLTTYAIPTYPERLCQQSAAAYTVNPGLHGVLRLLGYFSLEMKGMPPISKDLLALDRFDEPRFQLAALLVRLTQWDWDESEAKYLAEEMVRLEREDSDLRGASLVRQAVWRHDPSGPPVERFLLTVRGDLPTEKTSLLTECDALLSRLLRHRDSGLGDHARADELQLPDARRDPHPVE